MDVARRLTAQVEITAAGRAWPIAFTHAVLLDMEDATGLKVLAGEVDLFDPPARVLRAALWAVLRAAGLEIGIRDAGAVLASSGVPKIRAALRAAWRASMPDPEPPGKGGEKRRGARGWLEAWSMARQSLGLSDEEWLCYTPRMVHSLLMQRTENLRHAELLAGLICANVVNHSAHPPRHPVSPDAFMLHPWEEEADEKPLTGEDLMKVFSQYRKD